MAKHANKKQGIAGLIFTWILIILLALGAFGIFYYYKLNTSTLISNDQLAESLSVVLEKPVGKLTEEDVASIEGLSYADYGTAAEIMIYLPGYNAAYEAYNAEGVTEEQKKELTNPSSLTAYTTLSDVNIYDDLHLFKGITSINFLDLSGKMNENDILSIAAENTPNLTTFSIRSYEVKDFSAVEKLPKLETLVIYDSTLDDISAISSLKNLKYLDLSETGLTDISALSSLDNDTIEVVYLTGNEITDWSPLDHLDADKVIKEVESEETTDDSESSEETENADDTTEQDSESESEETTDTSTEAE